MNMWIVFFFFVSLLFCSQNKPRERLFQNTIYNKIWSKQLAKAESYETNKR